MKFGDKVKEQRPCRKLPFLHLNYSNTPYPFTSSLTHQHSSSLLPHIDVTTFNTYFYNYQDKK